MSFLNVNALITSKIKYKKVSEKSRFARIILTELISYERTFSIYYQGRSRNWWSNSVYPGYIWLVREM